MKKDEENNLTIDQDQFNKLEAWVFINKEKPENSLVADIIEKLLQKEDIKISPHARPKLDSRENLFAWAWAFKYGISSASREFNISRSSIRARIENWAKELGLSEEQIMEKDNPTAQAKEHHQKWFKNDEWVLALYEAHKLSKKEGKNIL